MENVEDVVTSENQLPEYIPLRETKQSSLLRKNLHDTTGIPFSRESENLSLSLWKPNIQFLGDHHLSDEDEIDFHYGLNLGSSVLFDGIGEAKSTNKQNSVLGRPSPYSAPRKSSYSVRYAITELFSNNQHPTALEMNQLTEVYSIRYKTLFEKLEEKRRTRNVICETGDNCERIRGYFFMEAEPLVWPNMIPELKIVLENMVEAQILSNKRLELGYVHVMMERTNLSPAVVRAFYSKWRQRLLSSGIPGYGIKDWRRDNKSHTKMFSLETQRKLEEVYLKKKYESDNKEWTIEEISLLSRHFGGVPVESIVEWINDRNEVAFDVSKHVFPKIEQNMNNNRIPYQMLKFLKEEYDKNTCPTQSEYDEIANSLGLRKATVRYFYQKKQKLARRKDEWEKARLDIMSLNPEQVPLLETVKNKTASEKMVFAESMGISFRSLCSYIDYKRFLRSKKQSKYTDV